MDSFPGVPCRAWGLDDWARQVILWRSLKDTPQGGWPLHSSRQNVLDASTSTLRFPKRRVSHQHTPMGTHGPSFCRFCLPLFRPQLGALRSCSALGGLEHAPASGLQGKGPGEAIIKAGSRDCRLRARTQCLNFGRGMDESHWNRHCEKPWVKNQHVSWCCV